jgi:hypothetical protein
VDLFCSLSDATDCIITSCEHPAIMEMPRRSTFAAAFDDAWPREVEVATVEAKFSDTGLAEDLVYENPDRTPSETPLRDTKGFGRPHRRRPRTN